MDRNFTRGTTRRELLKLSPVLLLGAFAVPSLQDRLLSANGGTARSTSARDRLVTYKPSQFSTLGILLGGYHRARVLHFLGMCGLLAFIPGHLIMVALHGWDNFRSMVTG